ncbi:MAG: VanZ family protein [Patescibacteria group bacterium]|mgnify:FL=1
MFQKDFSSTFLFRLVALLLWMFLIFVFSSMPGSPYAFDPGPWYLFERKGAHVVEYFILLILAVRFFSVLYKGHPKNSVLALSFVFCLMYAVTDELHQFFVPFRGSKIQDVLFDGLGASLAVGVFFFFRTTRLFKKR